MSFSERSARGSAINNFGVQELLDNFVEYAPAPLARPTRTRAVDPSETAFTGLVFKIQVNMDPNHRDRIAFLRVCSGTFTKGAKLRHVRLGRDVKIPDALTFMAADREHVDSAYPGDIIGIHNHGTIRIGDTFTEDESGSWAVLGVSGTGLGPAAQDEGVGARFGPSTASGRVGRACRSARRPALTPALRRSHTLPAPI